MAIGGNYAVDASEGRVAIDRAGRDGTQSIYRRDQWPAAREHRTA